VSQSVVCLACEKPFSSPEDGAEAWLVCPHCGAKAVNPMALERRIADTRPFSLSSLVGVLLVVFGGLALVVGTCGIGAFESLISMNRTESESTFPWRTCAVFCSSLAAIAGGFVLLRLDHNARRTGGSVVGKLLLLTVLVLLAALGGFIFAVSVCFS
jgi:hypothetical protein